MPTVGEYTRQPIGVLTFRTDAFRQNAAIGTVEGTDTLELAWTAEAGSARASNVALIGLAADALGFSLPVLRDAVAACVPAKALDLNLKAFDLAVERAQAE